MSKELLLEKVASAKRDIADAEADLERVLREIQVAPRADKTTISQVVQDAFAKLRAVRGALLELETLVTTEQV